MTKRTKQNRYTKKGGDIIGTYPQQQPSASSSFTNLFNTAQDAVMKAANSVGSVANKAVGSVGSVANKAVGSVGSVADKAVGSVGSVANKTVDAAGSMVNKRVDTLSSVANKTVGSLGPASNYESPSVGGKRCRKGGVTAKPQVYVGGKRRNKTCRKSHKHSKLCRVKTYKKGKKSKFSFSKSAKRLLRM